MAKYIIVAVLAVLGILLGASIAKDLKEKGRKPTKRPMQTKPLTRTGDVLVAVFHTADAALSADVDAVAGMVAEQVGVSPVVLTAGQKLPALDDTHIVLLGAPAAGGEWPEALADVLDTPDLDGKVLVPFGVNDVAGKAVLDKALRTLVPDVRVLGGYFASPKEMAEEPDNVQKDVYKWLWDLDLDTK